MEQRDTRPSKWRAKATYNQSKNCYTVRLWTYEKDNNMHMLTAAISSRSSFDKSGAIFTSNGGGPSSPHCISSRAAWTFTKGNFARLKLPSMQCNTKNAWKKIHILIPNSTFLTRSFSCFLPWSMRKPGVLGDETLIT